MALSPLKKPGQCQIVSIPDSELLTCWYNGNDEAFSTLVNRYYTQVLAYVLGLCKDRSLAEDITQDTFLNIFEKKIKQEEDKIANFKAFVFKAAHNNFRSNRRIHNNREAKIRRLDIPNPTYQDFHDFETRESRDHVLSHILNEDQKEVFELKDQGFNDEEVSRKIEKNPDQVRGLSHRGKKRLENSRKSILKFLFSIQGGLITLLFIIF